jgi:hypothetical protein
MSPKDRFGCCLRLCARGALREAVAVRLRWFFRTRLVTRTTDGEKGDQDTGHRGSQTLACVFFLTLKARDGVPPGSRV